MPGGRVKVLNETVYGGTARTIKAKIAGQEQDIMPNTSHDFNVPEGKQYLNVEVTPSIVGLASGHETINISDDFRNWRCKVKLDQNKWLIQKVSQ